MGPAASWPPWIALCACTWLALALTGATASEPPIGSVADTAATPEEPADFWTGPINGPVPKTISGGTVINTAEVRSLLERGDIALIEVSNAPRRPDHLAPGAPWLPKPHVIIPGSVWVPGAGMGEIAPEVDSAFREQLASATAGDLDRRIVIYCHERCWLSWNAAKRAIRYGYRSVFWYPEGIEGWRAAGLETAVSDVPTG